MRTALAFSLLVFACASHAAEPRIFRCGNRIQDVPCETTAASAPASPKLTCTLDRGDEDRAIQREVAFLRRFPDTGSHRIHEWRDLRVVADRIAASSARFVDLAARRVKIDAELEFYKGRPVPTWLVAQRDANEGQLAALVEIFGGQEQDVLGIRGRYACERRTLGLRWNPRAAPGESDCAPPC